MLAQSRLIVGFFGLLLALGFVLSSPANAALKRYETRRTILNHQASLSPEADFDPQQADNGVALVDDSGANPVLRRQVWSAGSAGTVLVPSLSGFAFFRGFSKSGPPNDAPGTGSTASSISWGTITGYTHSGASFCHSVPSYVCSLVPPYVDLMTVPAPHFSSSYDYGTWIFHGTGFKTAGGRLFYTSVTGPGNSQFFDRGVLAPTGVVPAVPLIGIASVGLSVAALAISSIRRKRG